MRGSGAVHGKGTAGRAVARSRARTAPQGSAPSPGDVSEKEQGVAAVTLCLGSWEREKCSFYQEAAKHGR